MESEMTNVVTLAQISARDRRFTVRREWAGYSHQRYVARFCGDFIGQAKTRREAREIAAVWNDQRMAA